MAGGLFGDVQFSINLKCVVGTIIVALWFWFTPRKNNIALISSIIIALIGTYLYDIVYSCKGQLLQDQVPYLNILKYIIIGITVYLVYQYVPRNKITLGISLWLPYLLLAWYDYFYQCSVKMDPTIFPFGRWIYLPWKPPEYQDKWKELSEGQKHGIIQVDNFILFMIIAFVISYVVYKLY